MIESEQRLKSELGIEDLSEISERNMEGLIRLAPRISKELQLRLLEQAPHLVGMFQQTAEKAVEIAAQNGKTTHEILSIMRGISESLGDLASKSTLSEEERERVLEMWLELARLLVEMDRNNKGFLLALIGGLGALAVAILLAIFGGKGGGRSNTS